MQRSLRPRAVTRGLAPTEPTDNVLVAYAARDGTTANDGDGRNSPFTTALLRNIETPGLEISFLFRNVRDEVMLATKREQQPFVYGSLSKEAIYLKLPASPTSVIASTTTNTPPQVEQSPNKQRQDPVSGGEPNPFTPEDAQRVAAMGSKLKLTMPAFAIGETKVDVPVSLRRFVGIWAGKVDKGEGRQKMLILTEALSDGLVLGYYVYGAPANGSWDNAAPAGYVNFAGKISDNALRFNSGKYPHEVKLSGANAMTMRVTDPDKKSKSGPIKFVPLWQLVPSASRSTEAPASTKRKRGASEPASQPKPPGPKVALESNSPCTGMPDKLGCLCALQNGGGISADGRGWYSKRGGQSALTNEAFVQCQLRAWRR
jgi:hypothetical protein